MNLYAPNSTSKRACLWLSLSNYESLMDCWLLGDDFNMTEDSNDRMGGIATTISRWEANCWNYFCFTYGLLDLWKVHSFSCTQGSL